MLEQIKNYLSFFYIKRNEAICICLENNIPLTDANIKDVKEILKQKKNNKIMNKK